MPCPGTLAVGSLENISGTGGDDVYSTPANALRDLEPDLSGAERRSSEAGFSKGEVDELVTYRRSLADPWAQIIISAVFGVGEVTMGEIERAYLELLVYRHGRATAARIAGINKSTLWRKLIDPDSRTVSPS